MAFEPLKRGLDLTIGYACSQYQKLSYQQSPDYEMNLPELGR